MSHNNGDYSDLSDFENASRDEDAEIEGDDLDEHIADDYRAIPELDRYDSDVDNEEYEAIPQSTRRMIEQDLDARDGRQTNDVLAPSSPSISNSHQHHQYNDTVSNLGTEDYGAMINEEDHSDNEQAGPFVNLDDFSGPLREWIALETPRREIRRRFRAVLTDYEDKTGEPFYAPRIASMCADFKQSLLVSYCHISTAAPTLGIWLADCPQDMLNLFDEEATAVVLSMYPEYGSVHDRIYVRITDLPVADNLRDLRQLHLNALVRVSGVVTRRSSVYPQLVAIRYNCGKCTVTLGPFIVNSAGQDDEIVFKPSRCPNCDSTGPFSINQSETIYRNYQKLTLQESPSSVPAEEFPEIRREEIDVTGTYMNNFSVSLNSQHGFPVFATIIEANYIFKRNDQFANSSLTSEDRETIMQLSRQPDIGSKIIASIAPAIYGHDDIRTAIALALFGGCCKQSPNAHRIRGDINVLLLGDPGTAKSQFLKYTERTSPRAVFTTGKGASAVGLTACVRRDPISHEWTLEGGALVLADSGHCLIDEFDKMNEKDRTSIHEAMEQQSISISKAGIITTLQARCSVIAAANPLKGRYDSSLTFSETLSCRVFDILCVVRDTVDPVADERLALHVVDSHIQSHPDNRNATEEPETFFDIVLSPIIPQTLLRKYIQYARQHCKPSLLNIDSDKVSKLYVDLRQQALIAGGIPVAVRHVESILRMAEAFAKMHLRDQVQQADVDMAIRVMLSSFIGAQKLAVVKHLEDKFQKYMLFKRSQEELLFFLLKQLVQNEVYRQNLARPSDTRDDDSYHSDDGGEDDEEARQSFRETSGQRVAISVHELESRAREIDIHNVAPFFESALFTSNRFSVEDGMILRSF